MLEGTKVNFFNGTSIREYKACLIPTKNLRFRIIGDKIEVKSGGWEGCSSFDPEYETDIHVRYNRARNSFDYKHEWWQSGDEDSWGSWREDTWSLSPETLNKGVLYIEGQEPQTDMILSFFKSCKNYTTVITVQPYWKQGDRYSKPPHLYDYFINTNEPVVSGTFVKLPRESFGVVVDGSSKRISLTVNDVKGYNYSYKEAIVVSKPDEIEYYTNLLEQIEHTNYYLEAKENLNNFINILFKDASGEKIYPSSNFRLTNLLIKIDENNYIVSTAFPEELTVNLFKHLNLAYKLKTELYTSTIRVYNYLNAKSFYNTLSKFEFFEAFEQYVKSIFHYSDSMTLFKVKEDPIVIYSID